MSRIKKEYILLLGAIFAPLILIGYFLFKPLFYTTTSDDPQYDLLFSARSYGEQGPDGITNYTFQAKGQHLALVAYEAKRGKALMPHRIFSCSILMLRRNKSFLSPLMQLL
jgi:hypothetical protein